ncbi:hypothetical protein HHI36_020052 [Cryptolaemus montrouzieri]|uniref:Laminin subunit alpha n=1 Tax=Cryptolaemus montrouzieri TaxID=559131 RepID=A0ABD2NAA7_9CUCU
MFVRHGTHAVAWCTAVFSLFMNGLVVVNSEILTPPYFNLAEGRKITATATCGEDTEGPELYCKLVGTKSESDIDVNVIQGQFCDICDPSKPDKRHPPEYAVDGMETWWQSPPLSRGMKYNKVNLTIDLGQEFHVAYVYIRMGNSPRPGLWVLEKSADYGKTYTPWQYFSDSQSDCETHFGAESLQSITRDDSVICTTEYSNILPLEGGEIPISLLINRPSSKNYFNSSVLQEWTRATNVRLRLLRTKNFLGHLMSVARQDPTVTRRYFYSIKDISIGGRCMCNGHADTCDIQDPSNPSILLCRCQHNTCGAKCNSCCPGFVQKAWRQSKVNKPFICEPCNCFQHSDQCLYDPEVDEKHLSLDIYGRYEGGGVCQNCQHNTMGINCNQCLPKYYRPFNKQWNETDVCRRCDCDNFYSTGNCSEGTGKCECRKEFSPPDCDSCSFGYFGYPNCKPCECFLNGTINLQCESKNGNCNCLPNFGGEYCKECAPGYYNFPECKPCECNNEGSLSSTCEMTSGNCTCKNNYGGPHCDTCQNGYYGFPSCSYCNCDLKGTKDDICDKATGQCICREEFTGDRCDKCKAGYYGYPDCQPCDCGKAGSLGKTCSEAGKCSCLVNYAGRTCEQCSPGYFNYSECTACECDSRGSNGISCDNDGKCECHYNFDGKRCDMCKEGFYNFPDCEDCNCHPAGVVAGFAGCGSVPAGELCQCKDRVEGRICNKCKPLYWNLNVLNPAGCEECNCNRAGVLGGIQVCDNDNGQCVCKPSVISRSCSECADGSYRLEEDNLFGCQDCGCDVGGSINSICDKSSGQCVCQSRVTGRTCKEPLSNHYFPTLYQYQYEVEDGQTPGNTSARYAYDEEVFPGYSWKGYGVFSALQNEILQEIYISKSSLYLMILKYVNKNRETVIGTIRIIPESYYEIEQKQQVQFKESHQPAFITVSGASGSTPTPFVINPGKWTVSIKVPKGLLVDYFVLLPEDYYLASILHLKVEKACKIKENSLCREYSYPNLTNFDTIGFGFGTAVLGSTQQPISEFYEDLTHLPAVHVKSKIPLIIPTQRGITIDLPVTKPGPYVLLINYVTPLDDPRTHTLEVNVTNDVGTAGGRVTLYSCTYTLLCRQAIINEEAGIGIFYADGDHLTIDLEGRNSNVALHSITAIPQNQWSLDYITPKPKCINRNGQCVPSTFRTPQETKKIIFEHDNEASKNQSSIGFNITSYFLLNSGNKFIDLRGKTPAPGYYTFILHYYQPFYPEFKINVIIQNGQFYEAEVPLMHCPSESGCRAIVTEVNGNFKFNLIENFLITFKDPGNKNVFLLYLLVVPSDFHTPQNLEEEDFDQTGEFIKTCAHNNFNIDTKQQGFCRDSVFSITAAHNGGARPCQCNFDGSTSFTCDKFGGQCPCKNNVIGRKCEACKTGYYGFPDCKPCNCPSTAYCDPSDGRCICPPRVTGERCDQCLPLTYGYDPIIGCEECNCEPLGVEGNDLQCDLLNGSCACKTNIDGRRCESCIAGHYAYPYCESCECDNRGTTEDICHQETAECFCKKNVVGPSCEICREGTFNLEDSNELGCTECFCFGKTTRCESSKLIMVPLIEMSGWTLLELNLTEKLDSLKYNLTLQTGEGDVGVDFTQLDITNKSIYLSAPPEYLGKRLHSYGGSLNYTIFYTIDQLGLAVSGPDVILEGNNTYLTYSSLEQPPQAQEFPFSVQLVESNFYLPIGVAAKREHIMEVLRDLKGIYIRAKYWTASVTSRLSKVSLDEAISYQFYNDNNRQDIQYANTVEECQCPPNYQGLSCEECAPGYYRIPLGPHGGYCVPCQCNGHSNECDVNTGICMNCTHHTVGDHCEKCEVGFHGNAKGGTPTDCLICACPLPIASNNFATSCDVSSDGEKISCECIDGYIGAKCDACASGFYGKPGQLGDYCKPCQCSGNINPEDPQSCDTVSGECLKCLNNTFGTACSLCAPGYFGDAIKLKDCQSCICDKLGTDHCNSHTGECVCKPNVEGEKCDRCKYEHFGFQSGKGCQACMCAEASESSQCDDNSGECKCKEGVAGRTCDRCAAGHWNYTADGCDSCGCKSDYSVGFGCNALTGQCECLQGVMGEKCDQCPYRWAFVPEYGCHECDTCTHALLNTTDALAELIDPVILEFDSTHSGYFTLKRLDNMRELLNELRPKFDEVDPKQISLNNSLTELQSLENLAKNLNRKANFSLENSDSLKKDADKLKEKSEKLLSDLLETEEASESAIEKINNIIIQLNEGSGPNIEAAVTQGEEILKNMKQYNLTVREENTINQLQKATELLHNITNFKIPGDNLTAKADSIEEGLKNFTAKLDDLYNNTQYSLNKANEAEQLLRKSG